MPGSSGMRAMACWHTASRAWNPRVSRASSSDKPAGVPLHQHNDQPDDRVYLRLGFGIGELAAAQRRLVITRGV